MQVYKLLELSNGDILLQKGIMDNKNYTIVNKENGDILLKKNKTILIDDIDNLKGYDFKKSRIVECKINNIQLNKKKYRQIQTHVYHLVNDGTQIIKYTNLNIKTTKDEHSGFYYLKNLGISVQGVDSNKCILEIVNQCYKNNIDLSLKIKMIDNILVHVKF